MLLLIQGRELVILPAKFFGRRLTALLVGRGECIADCSDDDLVAREADPAFLGDLLITDPDGEFTTAAFDQLDIDPKRFVNGGRRTGSPRSIRSSDLTETNLYFTHNFLLQFRTQFTL